MHNKNLNIDEIIEAKKKHLEQEIRKTIESEFLSTQTEIRQKHEEELQELSSEFIYMDELLKNDKAILKENLHKFIEENIYNKLKIDELSEDLRLKDKEIEHLKNLIELYKKSQQEQLDEFSTSINISTKETEINGIIILIFL
jgi:iron uptake system EfeUOB component EfeO/EfeM